MTASLLQVQNVSLNLGRSPRLLLSDISFELQLGEMAILLGPQGSGKTLLLQLLNGLRSPNQGQILWRGQPLSAQPPITLRRQAVYQPQQPRLLGMTGREAIAYPLRLQGLSNSAIHQRIDPWLETLKLPTAWLDQREATLSPLAAQAIALVRLLAMEPQLLLLDDLGLLTEDQGSPAPDSQPNALPIWEQPENNIKQALIKHLERGGAAVWAVSPNQHISQNEPWAIAQRLLSISNGRLLSNQPAMAETWQKQVADMMSQTCTDSDTREVARADEWD